MALLGTAGGLGRTAPGRPRWCYREGVAEVKHLYGGASGAGAGGRAAGYPMPGEAEQAGYWTLQSTVLQDNEASRRLHRNAGSDRWGGGERIARTATAAGWTPFNGAPLLQPMSRKATKTIKRTSRRYQCTGTGGVLYQTVARWNILSTMAQYLSARQTMIASGILGT